MYFVEMIPAVRSLSRSDKLRLIQFLAEDLARYEVSPSMPTEKMIMKSGGNGYGTEEQVQAVGLRNGVSRQDEDGLHRSGEDSVDKLIHEVGPSPTGVHPSYPYWSPDREYEAAAILMKLLEAEKSPS